MYSRISGRWGLTVGYGAAVLGIRAGVALAFVVVDVDALGGSDGRTAWLEARVGSRNDAIVVIRMVEFVE